MTAAQLELGLRRAPKVSPDTVRQVCTWLAGRGWVSARDIFAALGLDDRRMRVVAEMSDGEILSGQHGYRLLDRSVTLEECVHSSAWIIAQGKKMIRRGMAIRRRAHRLFHS